MSSSNTIDISASSAAAHARYDDYQESGVDWLGEIPAHWEVVRAEAFLTRKRNSVSSEDLDDQEVFHYSIPVIDETGDGQVEDGSEIGSSKTRLSGGELLVSKLNPRKSRVLLSELKDRMSVCSNEFVVMEPDGCDPGFAKYLYSAEHVRQYLDSMVQSATRSHQRANPDDITKMKAGWPPPDEQQAIAAFLDRETERIDALIEKKDRLIDLLEEKRTALISRVVTKGLDRDVEMQDSGVEWIGEIPVGWETPQLRRLIRPDTTITYGIVQAGPHVEDGIPYIRTGDMKGRSLPRDGYKRTDPEIDAKYSRSKLEQGDIVVAIRATVGKALQVPECLDGANLTQGTARVAPVEEVSNRFLLWAINSNHTQQRLDALSKGATFDEITLDMLRRLRVPFPPLPGQKKIAAYLDRETKRIDKLTDSIRNGIERLKEYRTALISAAVTGQVDVREEVETAPVG